MVEAEPIGELHDPNITSALDDPESDANMR